LAVLAGMLIGCEASAPLPPGKTNVYLYGNTRQLVELVESAAALIEQRGTTAFMEFDRAGSRWQTSPTYLFIYDVGGTCVWHGLDRELIGRNLLSFRDALGKPVVEILTEIGRRPERDAADWIFYLWQEQTEFQPKWKSSYTRKAVAPDGNVYLVGSGSSRIKMEKLFVQHKVDAAARLLQEQGLTVAFHELKDPSARFYFLGTFIFVLDDHGHSLVDPAYPTIEGRDMTGLRDATGRPIVQELLQKLKTADVAWVQFLWPRPGEMLPTRKLMYMRKVQVGSETLLVGSDFYLATPIWMRL
jgi:signal transduction histidine kinase